MRKIYQTCYFAYDFREFLDLSSPNYECLMQRRWDVGRPERQPLWVFCLCRAGCGMPTGCSLLRVELLLAK